MQEIWADLAAFIEEHRFWAGPILGLITFGESMVLIGAFFPATVLMVAAGGLAGAGVLDPVSLVLWCVAGAAGGDAVSYALGRHVGPRAWRHRFLRPHRKAAARARLFFRKFGVLSIYMCRFMGPVRAFVPLIAGMTLMSRRRFQIANVGSAVIWVPVMLAPGYLAAKGVAVAGDGHSLGYVILLGILITVALAVAWRVVKARLSAAEPAVAKAQVNRSDVAA